MLNVHRWGPEDGPATLCLHGVTGHGQRFTRLATDCLKDRRVLAPDLRGHGRSPWTPPWTAEQHIGDLIDVLEAEGVEMVDIVGHSFGGLVATHLASAIGEHVGRVVLLDPAIEIDAEMALENAEDSRNPPSWGSLDEAKAARREQRTPAGYPGSDQDVDDHAQQGEDGRFRFRYLASAAVTAWSEMAGPVVDLREWEGRLHLVTAAQAPYVTDSTREWLSGDLGDRFSETVIDSSHMLYWDAYDQTAAEVAAFLSATSRRPKVDRVLVALLATVAFWALNVIVVKWAVGTSGQWDPLAYSFIRLIIGAVLLVAFVRAREGSVRIERRDVPLILVSALIGIAINQLGFMYAATYATATTISLILATIPAFAAITASMLGHERIGGRHWLGIGVAAVGTALVLQAGPGELDISSVRGDVLALLAAASWGVYSALVRPLLDRYSPNRISTVVVCAALPMLAVVSLPQVLRQDYGSVTLGGWGALLFSVFFSLVITNVLWFGAIQAGGAARATAVLPIQPFLGALFAFVLLGETVTWLQIAGGLIVVVGIWLTRRRTLVLAD